MPYLNEIRITPKQNFQFAFWFCLGMALIFTCWGFYVYKDCENILSYKQRSQGILINHLDYIIFEVPVVEFINPIDQSSYRFNAWYNLAMCGRYLCTAVHDLHYKIEHKIPQLVAFDPHKPSRAFLSQGSQIYIAFFIMSVFWTLIPLGVYFKTRR